MPHQCVHCDKLYEDGSSELLKGCVNCGGKFFFYIDVNSINEAKEITANLTHTEKNQIERDVLDIVGENINKNQPVFLDFESIKVIKPGQYEVDLVHLFKGKPLIYKLGDGKYIIDLVSTFKSKDKEIE